LESEGAHGVLEVPEAGLRGTSQHAAGAEGSRAARAHAGLTNAP